MLLAIDVGNTNTCLGVYQGDELERMWRLATNHAITSDQLCVEIKGLFDLVGADVAAIDGAVIGTVVPHLRRLWEKVVDSMMGVELLSVDMNVASPLMDFGAYASGLGADRIANAIAASRLYGNPAIVVDFGTATNIEVVSASGAFAGGAIAAGVETSMRSLFGGTALLPEVELTPSSTSLGLDTPTSIQVGIVYGAAYQVDGLVTRMWDELGYHTPVVATGGLAHTMGRICHTITHVDVELTLQGLKMIHAHYSQA